MTREDIKIEDAMYLLPQMYLGQFNEKEKQALTTAIEYLQKKYQSRTDKQEK